ncbi:MAG: hypothetical protein L0Y74_05700, partial [candidate division Zixibacteria bacterium]|nr:hypothetical protein [candidate division Zixibacteria bacterium]
NLVVRAFFDTGSKTRRATARGKLCIDGDPASDASCPTGLVRLDSVEVFPTGHDFTYSELKQGKNSLNFRLNPAESNRLTPGPHTIRVRIEAVRPADAFQTIEDSIKVECRAMNIPEECAFVIQLLVFPIRIFGRGPADEGPSDAAILKNASKFLEAVYPVDEEFVNSNDELGEISYDTLPFAGSEASVNLMKKIDTKRKLYMDATGEKCRVFAVGVVNTHVNVLGVERNPFNQDQSKTGPHAFSYPAFGNEPRFEVALTRDRKASQPDSGSPVIGQTVAHEIGHLFGLGEEYAGQDTVRYKPNVNPPPPDSLFNRGGDGNGWYVLERDTAYDVNGILQGKSLPVFCDPVQDTAIYGYMGNARPSHRVWTREPEYRHLFGQLTKPSGQAPSTLAPLVPRDVVGITGTITATDSVKFDPLLVFTNTDMIVPPLPTGNGYRLEFRDSSEVCLNGFDFDVDFSIEFWDDSSYYLPTDIVPLSFLSDLPAGTHSIALLKSGLSIANIVRSANPPTVNIASVRPKDGGLQVIWQGADPDGDSLVYHVIYYPDSSRPIVLGVNIKDTVFQITFDSTITPPLPGQGSVTVRASDGFNNTVATAPVEFCPCPILGDLICDSLFLPSDVVCLLQCVFLAEAPGNCRCELCISDANCDGMLTPADVVLLLNRVFLGAPLPC